MNYSETHPIKTLRAPNGVINIGGAKVYAAKFATVTWQQKVGQENSVVTEDVDSLSPNTTAVPQHTVSARYQKKDDLLNAQVDMPAHQVGFRKYERLSEACVPYVEFKAASFKP